jgi:hypothetical protein
VECLIVGNRIDTSRHAACEFRRPPDGTTLADNEVGPRVVGKQAAMLDAMEPCEPSWRR